jgi:hypothetical protein
MRRLGIWAVGVFLIGCSDGGGPRRLPDAPPAPIDAAIDAPLPLPNREITGGAQHVRGSRFAADVQIGHPIGQQPTTKGARRLEGNAAVKP